MTAPVLACVNSFEHMILECKMNGSEACVAEEVAKLEKTHKSLPTLQSGNDLGVARMLTGRFDEAVALLEETEKKYPNSARVAANLGTALELKGRDEEALRWIREGIERDIDEHQGSEWVHVRILEAKLQVAKDPDWLKNNRVIAADFGGGDVPVLPVSWPKDEQGNEVTAEKLFKDVTYQISERIQFVNAPDAIVADLYELAGDLTVAWQKSNPTYRYRQALDYGTPRAELVRARLAPYAAQLERAGAVKVENPYTLTPEEPRWNVLAAVLAALGALAGGWLIYRYRIQGKRDR